MAPDTQVEGLDGRPYVHGLQEPRHAHLRLEPTATAGAGDATDLAHCGEERCAPACRARDPTASAIPLRDDPRSGRPRNPVSLHGSGPPQERRAQVLHVDAFMPTGPSACSRAAFDRDPLPWHLRATGCAPRGLWILAVSLGVDLVMDPGRRTSVFHASVESVAIIAAAVGVMLGARGLRTALHETHELREQARTLVTTSDPHRTMEWTAGGADGA